MWDFLNGKTTYLQSIAGMAVLGAMNMGWLDMTTGNAILGFLGFGIVMSVRRGLGK